MAEKSDSSLTPVRIRGKNHRSAKQQAVHLQSHPSFRSHSRKKIPAMASGAQSRSSHCLAPPDSSDVSAVISSSEKPQLSCFEKLPTELLQAIFFLCPNLSLPVASPHLYNALNSRYVRTELIVAAFTSDSNPPRDREHRSALLRQRWVTFDFLRDCQKAYMIQLAIQELQLSVSFMPKAVHTEAVSLIGENFARYYPMGDRYLSFTRKFHHKLPKRDYRNDMEKQTEGSFSWYGRQGTGSMFIAYLLGEGSELVVYSFSGSQPEIRAMGESPRRPSLRRPHHSKVFRFPDYLNTCEIPEKLLRGPWTQKKGDFLKMLLDGGAAIDWVNSTSGEVASKGLEDAIRENNLLAVIALVIGRPYIPFSEKSNAEASMRESECARELALEKGRDGNYYKTNSDPSRTPWLVRTGKPWKDIKTVGVVPTTAHMRIAVTQASKSDIGPIISWMAMASKIDVDPDDPEIVTWALRNMAEWNGKGPKPMRRRRRLSSGLLSEEWTISGQFVLAEMDHMRERLLSEG